MSTDDKMKNKAEDLAGRGKEAAGAMTGDDSLKAAGETDQKKAGIKDKVEDVKDKVTKKIDDL